MFIIGYRNLVPMESVSLMFIFACTPVAVNTRTVLAIMPPQGC